MPLWEASQSEWAEREGVRTVILARVAELEWDEAKEEKERHE
jgi:hypothetical protein